MENYFLKLNSIDCSNKIEKKNGLTYLSWAWAWDELMKIYPDATYKIKKFGEEQLPYVYDENTGYMVFTEMTIDGITHEMWLPVMDGANKAMKNKSYTYKTKFGEKFVEPADMFDINKTIMRCLVKNIAMFGLGLYIYAGEDLPESEKPQANEIKNEEYRFRECKTENELKELWKEIGCPAYEKVKNEMKQKLNETPKN